MKIYIVADGDYSDYHIEAVFTEKKSAERYAAMHRHSYVSEWESDETKIEGDIDVCIIHKFGVHNGFIDLDAHYYSNKKVSGVQTNFWGDTYIYVSLDKFDEYKAEKIATDMYAQWKYEQSLKGGVQE